MRRAMCCCRPKAFHQAVSSDLGIFFVGGDVSTESPSCNTLQERSSRAELKSRVQASLIYPGRQWQGL